MPADAPTEPDGKPKPEYTCSTISTNQCVEDCCSKELPFLKAPPNYTLAAKVIGGYVCSDWADDIMMTCQAKCRAQVIK